MATTGPSAPARLSLPKLPASKPEYENFFLGKYQFIDWALLC
jgi:hypothetical protein